MRQKAAEPITIARSYFPDEDIQVFLQEAPRILRGRVSMGTWFERFQEAAARAQETRFACATNSCTAALEIALLACGVKPGDRVAVPAQTFIATGMAVHNIGAVPIFCDIRKETLCMNPDDLVRRCGGVKAVIVVHFGGLISSDIVRIAEMCRQQHIALIEDAAHAHGARYGGKAAGAFGEAACFSFYPTKILTCGEGGMVVTNSEAVEAVCRSYQFRGQDLSQPGEQFALPYGRQSSARYWACFSTSGSMILSRSGAPSPRFITSCWRRSLQFSFRRHPPPAFTATGSTRSCCLAA